MSDQASSVVDLTAVVLAGGQSRRMGTDKALLSLGGRTLIEAVIATVSALSSEVIVVSNATQSLRHLGVRLVSDVYPGKGSLGGIYTGLRQARTPYSLVVACDMPFLNLPLLRYMASLASQADVVIPRASDPSRPQARRQDSITAQDITAKELHLHPLHAIYAQACQHPIERLLAAGELRIIDFFPEVRVRYVEEAEVDRFDVAHLSLFNVNTPADLAQAQAWLARRSPPAEKGK